MGSGSGSANDVHNCMEHGAMRRCGSGPASWKREEEAVGRERRGIDDKVDEPFACLGRDAMWGCLGRDVMWGCEMSVGAMGCVTSGVVTIGCETSNIGTVMAKDRGE
jgi:hypothetical protein